MPSPSLVVRFIQLVGVLVVSASVSHGQVKKPMTLGFSAGASVPNGSFSEFYETGFHFAGGVSFQPRPSPIGFRVDAMFNQFHRTLGNANTNILSFTGDAVIAGAAVTGPYLLGGVGVYSASQPDAVGRTTHTTDVGMNVGAGYRFALTSFDAFAEARWHQAGDAGLRFIPLSFGVVF